MTPTESHYTNSPSAYTNRAYLLTGGNMGDRVDLLRKAAALIEENCGPVVRTSAIYETAAWGLEDQPSFLNQVIELQTGLAAPELMQALLGIERELGRVRDARYGPRLIDIDILFYNDAVIDTENLLIPHPRMDQRRFVLTPLNELIPHFVHPVLGATVAQLLADCADPLAVNKFS